MKRRKGYNKVKDMGSMTIKATVKTALRRSISACVANCREILTAARRTHASTPPSQLNWRDPVRSAFQGLVWLAAKGLVLMVSVGRATFELLTEASADVGEIIVRRRGGAA